MKYSDSHEWVQLDGDVAIVGISNYAQEELGEVVYIELPKVGDEVKVDQEIAVLESTKAAADIYAPLSGTVVEVNQLLLEDLALLNKECEKRGWLVKIEPSDKAELDSLLDHQQYLQLIS